VIDDTGGLDPTVERLSELEDVEIVTPPFNLGHQRAIVFGLRKVASRMAPDDIVVTLDSDGEDRPEDLPRLLSALENSPEVTRTVVLAKRTKRREPFVFKVLYFFFRILFKTLTGLVIRTGNFAAYRAWLAQNIIYHPHFDVSYSSSLLALNLRVVFVPCERGVRYAGQSRMGYLRLIMHGLRMLMPFLDRIAIRSLIGFSVLLGLGVMLSAVVVAIRVLTDLAIPGWATYTLLLMVVLSVIALGNFVILFTVFSQSQGVSLAGLDRRPERSKAETFDRDA
jgi:hypothetical protein